MELLAILQVVSITVGVLTIASMLLGRTFPWIRSKLQSRAAHRHLKGVLTREQIEHSVRYYIRPLCQDLDPAGAEEPRLAVGVQQDLFQLLDRVFTHPTEFRYLFILADSGMGKTSGLINYYVRHLRRWRKRYKLEYVPLGIPDADERIDAIQGKEEAILLLDAFDEDTLAIVDHVERLRLLAKNTRQFARVLITCRTQFFARDEEIPLRTGIIKIAARTAGEQAEYLFHKIYLSPFSDQDVERYICRRYPLWRWTSRRAARQLVSKVPYLSVRPMLLSHIDDVVRSDRHIQYTFELYEEMIQAWILREKGFVSDDVSLRRFSELIALDLYMNREARGGERISHLGLEELARKGEIPIEGWALTGRSLLNRDAEGNYKFAHRSIMEYLLAFQIYEEPAKRAILII